jgi:hypothetical protein
MVMDFDNLLLSSLFFANILKFDICEMTTDSYAMTMNNGLKAINMNLEVVDND